MVFDEADMGVGLAAATRIDAVPLLPKRCPAAAGTQMLPPYNPQGDSGLAHAALSLAKLRSP